MLSENYHLLNADRLAQVSDGALLIVLSRAHLVDFDALNDVLKTGRIRVCIDVFPSEPVAPDAAIRRQTGAILSPHRAAAVDRGRQLIGDMIVSDLTNVLAGVADRQLSQASTGTITLLAGVGDAAKVADMAKSR